MSMKKVKPDARGRIALGHLADGVSRFEITINNKNQIILTPYMEIPATEAWLYKNKEALQKVKQGLDDAAKGRVSTRGSFAKFLDEDE